MRSIAQKLHNGEQFLWLRSRPPCGSSSQHDALERGWPTLLSGTVDDEGRWGGTMDIGQVRIVVSSDNPITFRQTGQQNHPCRFS